jgi:peptidoglycan/xylan/chitin deacetylase (PgdA/CDA1 family)
MDQSIETGFQVMNHQPHAMPLWKSLLLNAYYHASLPMRWWIRRRLAAQRRAPIIALYYHRVADDDATPCTMSNQAFVNQMRWLKRNFEMISMEEVQRRMRSGVNDRAAVHITFDDGYSDNCQTAIPWLVKERIPCTYFVTVENVLEAKPFAHDLNWGAKVVPNSLEQIRAMANAGIEIGAHTYCHPDLGTLTDPTALRREIVVARQELRAAIDRPVRYFSFPFGLHQNLSCQAFLLAAQSGYECVCSAYGGYNFPGDDPFHVHRIPAVAELLRLKNWLNSDPRKLKTQRFEYRWDEERTEAQQADAQVEQNRHVVSP